MPYDFSDDPVSESEQRLRLQEFQREQAETLRDKLGGPLYDWLDDFCDDLDFLTQD